MQSKSTGGNDVKNRKLKVFLDASRHEAALKIQRFFKWVVRRTRRRVLRDLLSSRTVLVTHLDRLATGETRLLVVEVVEESEETQ